MGALIVALAGTPAGAQLAVGLALLSAFAHAAFGALQKGRHDPWVTRGAIDTWIALLALPLALFAVPWPHGWGWGVLAGAGALHFGYKLCMALAYERAAYTVVYPVVRGTGPLVTLAFAATFLGEHYGPLQWLGVALLSGAILALAAVNLRAARLNPGAVRRGIGWALAGGLLVACYTTWDAWGIRLTPDPFTFLAWFFFLTSLDFPVLVALRLRSGATRLPPLRPLAIRGLIGALTAFVSFGGVMLATRLGEVGTAAALRETSTLFAALIGWLVLREPVGPLRAVLMAAVAAGAVLVQVG